MGLLLNRIGVRISGLKNRHARKRRQNRLPKRAFVPFGAPDWCTQRWAPLALVHPGVNSISTRIHTSLRLQQRVYYCA